MRHGGTTIVSERSREPTPVLDTNFLIRLEARDELALNAFRVLQGERLLVPAQVVAEYLVRAPQREPALARLQAAFHIVHTTDQHLLVAATIAAEAFDATHAERARWGDIHIAAAARLAGTYVVTMNKRHFRQLGVDAWHYTKEATPPVDGAG